MSTGTTDFDPAWIRDNQDFLRRLARSLVRDEQQAEDVVQETWLGLWQAGARGVHSVRAWMNTAVRHRALNQARNEARRGVREERGGRERLGEAPAAAEIEEHLDAQTAVAAALRALAEPYRTTVFLRYYEDLAPAAIAQRTGEPVTTVKTRLQRGLAQLRRELDRNFGNDRDAWIAALLPWTRAGHASEAQDSLRMNPAAVGQVTQFGAGKKLLLACVALVGVVRLARMVVRANEDKPQTLRITLSDGTKAGPAPALEDATPKSTGRAPVPPVAGPQGDQDAARLRLHVIDGEGRPIEGISVSCSAPDEASFRFALPEHGIPFDFESALRTNASGDFELETTSQSALHLELGDDTLRFEGTERRLEPLEAGQLFEQTITLVPVGTHLYWARLLAEEDGTPISGAHIEFRVLRNPLVGGKREERAYASTVSDAAGFFTGPRIPSDTTLCDVQGAGRKRVLLLPQEGHATRETAEVVRLPLSSTLTLQVASHGGLALSELVARVRIPAYSLMPSPHLNAQPRELEWTATLDARGIATLADVAPGAVFDLELLHGTSTVHASARQDPLAPGEERRLEVSLGAGGIVRGRLLDPRGTPLAGRRVTAQPAWTQAPFYSFHDLDVKHQATTDEAGAFELRDLAPGSWWIGPANTRKDRWASFSRILDDTPQHLAPWCEVVEITPEEPVRVLELRREAGLYVRGRVLASDGSPATSGSVSVRGERPMLYSSFSIDREGRFAVGPLAPGECSIEAQPDAGDTSSLALQTSAGATDLVLQRRVGAQLELELLDARTRAPLDARLALLVADENVQRAPSRTNARNGRQRYRNLAPGRYHVLAQTADDRVALELGIELDPSGASRTLLFEPGARLALQNGPQRCGVRMLVRGERIAFDYVDPATRREFVLPAGALVVEWLDRTTLALLERVPLELVPGETRVLARTVELAPVTR